MQYNENEIDKILQEYKLSDEEHKELYNTIKRIWTLDKFPVKNPIAVIIGGQTGAGKSGIISYSQKMFDDRNVIIINSDEIKPFHPKSEEIAKKYPELYTKITDQESNTWTSQLFEDARNEGYNIIFEGTMKNNRVADDAIVELLKRNYTVIVRGLAVCDLESRLSIHERYEAQVATKGWGRLVVPEHHNKTYEGMPNTIQYIEEQGRYDILELFKRGKTPDSPELIYAAHNDKTLEKTKKSIDQRNFVSSTTKKYGYQNGKQAILQGREEDYDRVLPTCEERFKTIKKYMDMEKVDKSNNVSKEEQKERTNNYLGLMKFYEEIKNLKKKFKINNDHDDHDER